MELNALISPARIMFPASQLRGESAHGSESNAIIAWHTDRRPQAGVQDVFRMFRHISPLEKSMLGWKTGVMNLRMVQQNPDV